jgi:hypothetical protein
MISQIPPNHGTAGPARAGKLIHPEEVLPDQKAESASGAKRARTADPLLAKTIQLVVGSRLPGHLLSI